MPRIYANNAASTLAIGIAADTTTLVLQSATHFPALSGHNYFILTLTDDTTWEMVKVTAISGTTLTVERGAEGTTAQVWSAGTKAEIRLTKAGLDSKQDSVTGTWVLTDGVSSNVFELSLLNGEITGGVIHFTLAATTGAAVQVLSGTRHFCAARIGGTVHSDLSDEYVTSMVASESSGTLALAWALSAGTSSVTLSVTPDTSLVGATLTLRASLISQSGGDAAIL